MALLYMFTCFKMEEDHKKMNRGYGKIISRFIEGRHTLRKSSVWTHKSNLKDHETGLKMICMMLKMTILFKIA